MQPDPPALHPYKLRSIELKDFKSISHAKVSFSPLTTIVGANSSGKSSLLQAILALTQSVRFGDSTGRFPLNGELVRLGTFEETKNFSSDTPDSPIQITAVLVTNQEIFSAAHAAHYAELEKLLSPNTDPLPEADLSIPEADLSTEPDRVSSEDRILWSLDLAYGDNIDSGSLRIQSLKFEVFTKSWGHDYEDEILPHLACNLSEIATNIEPSASTMFVHTPDEIEVDKLLFTSGQFIDWDPWWWYSGDSLESVESYNCDAALIVGGIPYTSYTRRSRIESYANCWWDHALDTFISSGVFLNLDVDIFQYFDKTANEMPNADITAVRVAAENIKFMYDIAKPEEEQKRPREVNDFKLLGNIVKGELEALSERDTSGEHDQWRIANSMAQLGEPEFRNRLQKLFEEESWAVEVKLDESEQPIPDYPNRAFKGSMHLRDFFKKSVRHLGPLRAEPRSLYGFTPNDPDLGVNGENAASILHLKADQEVLLPIISGLPRHTNLASALSYWLQEFGMADSSQVEDRGRLGFDLRVSPPPFNRFVDLTSVGVGVSQVVPVILLCLLAEPGDLVILEQPELHLHPALQHKLADFLLECTRSGRQILVETHSEHLINRLRRRVAEDDSDETESLIGLLFAEQYEGQTTFSESKINAYGGLSRDWPDGFLDLGAREAQHLVRSSVYKHRRRQNRDEPLSDERKDVDEP